MKMKGVQITGLGEKASAKRGEPIRQIGRLYPGFLEFDLDFAFFLDDRHGQVAEIFCVDVGFQVDLGLADRKSGFTGADFARRLEAG